MIRLTILILIVLCNDSEARTARQQQLTTIAAAAPTKVTESNVKSTTTKSTTAVPVSTSSSAPSSSAQTTSTIVHSSPVTTTTTTPVPSTAAIPVENVKPNNRIQLLSSSGSTLATNIFTSLSDNVANFTNQLAQRFNLKINATETLSNLWRSIRRSDLVQSPLTLSAATVTFAGFLSMFVLYLFPSLRNAQIPLLNDRHQLKKIGEIGRSIEQFAVTVNDAIDSYSRSEPDTCVMMALCTLGKAKEVTRKSRAIETINTVLNFPGLDQYLISNKTLLESHAYGREGNDCDAINLNHKCPFNYDTWRLLLSSLSSVL